MKEWIAEADLLKKDGTSERMIGRPQLFSKKMVAAILYRMDNSKWSFEKNILPLHKSDASNRSSQQ